MNDLNQWKDRLTKTLEPLLGLPDPRPRISAYDNLPFAIFIYPPEQEFPVQEESVRLATRLGNKGKRVTTVSLAERLWTAVEREGYTIDELAEAERDSGWDAMATTLHDILRRTQPLEDLVAERHDCTADELARRGLPLPAPPLADTAPNHLEVRTEIDPVVRTRSEYGQLRDALASRIIGRDVVDRLALIALAHRRGVSQRILLTGGPGTGKSFMARSLAEVVGVPFYLQDATGLTETGYRGLNVPDLVEAMHRNAGSDRSALEASVLFLDEIEKTRIGQGVDGVSLDKRWGMQAGLLSLLDGKTPIVAQEGALSIRTNRILIICAGAFSDAPWSTERAPTTTDLVQYGLLRELAERLRDRIFLPSRTADELAVLLRQSDESVEAVVGPLARELGLELRVLPSAYTMVARMVAEERAGLGPRSGNQLLVSAGQRAILRALSDDSEPVAVVTPDDIDLLLGARR